MKKYECGKAMDAIADKVGLNQLKQDWLLQ